MKDIQNHNFEKAKTEYKESNTAGGAFDDIYRELSTDRSKIGSTAEQSFKDFDEDKDGELVATELWDAANNSKYSDTQRAVANLLLANFDSAKNLASESISEDVANDMNTYTATQRYEEHFAGDAHTAGISEKDIAAMNLLANEDGKAIYSQNAETMQVVNGVLYGAEAVVKGVASVLAFGATLPVAAASGPLAPISGGAMLATGGILGADTLSAGYRMGSEFFGYAPDELNAQFDRKMQEFKGWQV